MKTTEQRARDLVDELFPGMSTDAKERLAAGVAADLAGDPLEDIPRRFGAAAARIEAEIVWQMLTRDGGAT